MENLLYIYEKDNYVILKYKDKEEKYRISMHRVLRKICLSYGREYLDQLKFSAKLLKIRQKVPLLLDVKKKYILFPLYGKRSKNNIYINYAYIFKVKMYKHKSLIVFDDTSTLLVEAEIQSLRRAQHRCCTLLKIIHKI